MVKRTSRLKIPKKYNQVVKTIQNSGAKIFLFPFHPILFAIYPILFLYNQNIKEVYLSETIIPLSISLISATIILVSFNFVFKSINKAAFFSSLFIIIFFSHGHLHKLIGERPFWIWSFKIGVDKTLFFVWVLLLTSTIFFLLRTRKKLLTFKITLNIVAIFLVLIPLSSITLYELSSGRILKRGYSEKTAKELTEDKRNPAGKNPDIYYLIFDSYAGNDTIEGLYKYENSSFMNFLKERGFYIATKSNANYAKSSLSLASSLNIMFLNDLSQRAGNNSSETLLYPLIEDNKVVSFLKSAGYNYYHVGSWWPPTSKNRNATKGYQPNGVSYSDNFSSRLIATTALLPIIRVLFPNTVYWDDWERHYKIAIFQLNTLETVVNKRGPKFVFAHVL